MINHKRMAFLLLSGALLLGLLPAWRATATSKADNAVYLPALFERADSREGTTSLLPIDGQDASLSADGRFVAYTGYDDRPLPPGSSRSTDVFVYDRQAGQKRLVSVSSGGEPGDGDSESPAISANGCCVAFTSAAANLEPGNTYAGYYDDIFVHDRQTGQTNLGSVQWDDPATGSDEYSSEPAISADGRFVAFQSQANNLIPNMSVYTQYSIFVYDRQTGLTRHASVSSTGTSAGEDSRSTNPVISGDGRLVAFLSDATNLVPGDNNNLSDVFVHDLHTGETRRASVNSAGKEGYADMAEPAISQDGRYVAFSTIANNLVDGDTNGEVDVFVHDLHTGRTTRASLKSNGEQSNGHSRTPTLSADGRLVAFASEATDLVPGDTNDAADIFVHDRQTGRTVRASVDPAGEEFAYGESSIRPYLSADGRNVLFYNQDRFFIHYLGAVTD